LATSSAFDETRKVEAEALKELIPFLRERAFEGRFVVTDKGNLSRILQKTVGDVLFNCQKHKVWAVEIKSEVENKWNNFFLEIWSNLKRFTPGWMLTLQADILMYYFQKEKELYVMSLPKLKEWAFINTSKNGERGRIWDFPEKQQSKYVQLNDTWGRCVPIPIIAEEVGFSLYKL